MLSKIQLLIAPDYLSFDININFFLFIGFLIYTVKTMQLFYIWLLHFCSVPEHLF